MSHKATMKVDLYDEDALRDTLTELGIQFVEQATWIAYNKRENTPVDFLIEKGSSALYDRQYRYAGIGFRNDGGKLELVMDGLDEGSTCYKNLVKKFKRVYTEKAASNLLSQYGYRVEKQPDGTYRATATARTISALSRQAQTKSKQQVRIGRY